MRRVLASITAAALGCGLAAPLAVGAAARGQHIAAHPYPARMLIYSQEWSLWLSRASVPAGQVSVQLWNRGQDAHDLRIQRTLSGDRLVGRPQGMAITVSGKISTATWQLRPGRYEVYCSLPGHRRLGMHALLRVAAPSPAAGPRTGRR